MSKQYNYGLFVVAFLVAFCATLCLSVYFSLQSDHYANKLELTQDSLRVERSHVRLLEANMKILNKNRYK